MPYTPAFEALRNAFPNLPEKRIALVLADLDRDNAVVARQSQARSADVAERVSRLCAEYGWNAATLASATGYTESFIIKFLRNERPPSAELISAIFWAFRDGLGFDAEQAARTVFGA